MQGCKFEGFEKKLKLVYPRISRYTMIHSIALWTYLRPALVKTSTYTGGDERLLR